LIDRISKRNSTIAIEQPHEQPTKENESLAGNHYAVYIPMFALGERQAQRAKKTKDTE
jgi:hypothetical protein